MADVLVTISAGEETASGLGDPVVTYEDATAGLGAAALLLVSRGDHVLAEFPAGRYVSYEEM